MQIRTFQAPTIQEALAMARQEMGEDAVVLNTKHHKTGGLLGIRGETKVELMAAVDDPAATPVSVAVEPPPAMPGHIPDVDDLRRELRDLGMVVRGLVADRTEPGPAPQSPLLLRLGVDDELAHGALAELLPIDEPSALATALAGKLQAFASPPSLQTRQVIALVGPTGVGKTTTLAKLAARFALEQRAKVAMVTADTFRIGAVEQLKTYARIMGIPLEVALSPKETAAAVKKHADKDLVLIDTVGRSQRADEHLAEIKSFLDAARPTETHLVIAASLAQPTQQEVVEKFAELSPTRLIITKLDETVQLGCIVNLPLRTGLAISCMTAGQNVPQDLDFADAGAIARLVVGVA